ncbi:MAG: nucleotide disphospho-sugar-binding domain-containing protein [Sphingomonas sp.]|uniref:nucleotide disphospho-sugar-binding domain-containing protein n=1 Tax=Sphingomonas sp. TaxID=28214 RepID=UPI0035640FCC
MVPWKAATMRCRHDAGKVIASFFRKGRTALSSVVLAITGTLGDLHPFLALALRLRADGLSPIVAAMEDYRAVVEAEGIAFHAVRPGAREMAATGLDEAAVARAVTGDLRAGFDIMLPHIAQTVEDLRAVMADADLVICGTLAAVARIVAESAGVPVVTVALQPMSFLSVAEPPTMREMPFLPTLRKTCGPAVVRMLYALASAQGRPSMRPVTRLRHELGLPAVRDELLDGPRRSERIFAMYPPAFAALPSDAPCQARGAGFAYYDGRDGTTGTLAPALTRFLDAGPAPLVFTLGSFVTYAPGNFYTASAQVARRLGRRAILLVGDHALRDYAGLADDDIAVAGYAPHSLLFPRAAAVIQHGGMGTTAQALRAGVPQLVCPFFGDQFDNARRLHRLGVARVVALRRYGTRRAVAALGRLLDSPDAADRARALAPQMTRDDGPAIIAHWVTERLAHRPDGHRLVA